MKTKAVLFDLSKTLLFSKEYDYSGSLNDRYMELKDDPSFEFDNYFQVNNEVLDFLKDYKREVDLYIYTSRTIQEDPVLADRLDPVFRGVFSGSRLNLPKDKPESFQVLCNKIGKDPVDVLFVDDQLKNVRAAQEAGVHGVLYRSDVLLKERLRIFSEVKEFIDKLAYLHIKDHKVLVTLSKGKDKWYIPGGKREFDESNVQALIREINEELDVQLKPETVELFEVFDAQADRKPEGTYVRMTCYTGNFDGQLKPSNEIDKIDFFSFGQRDQTAPVDVMIMEELKRRGMIV